MPAFYRAAYLSNDGARQAGAEVVAAFGRAHEQRAKALALAQFLSPTILTQRLLHRLSEADLPRQHRFQAETRQALFELSAALGPAVVSRNRITLAEFDALPSFQFQSTSPGGVLLGMLLPILFLLVAAALLARAAQRQLGWEEAWT